MGKSQTQLNMVKARPKAKTVFFTSGICHSFFVFFRAYGFGDEITGPPLGFKIYLAQILPDDA
jgi:hypothetical protein